MRARRIRESLPGSSARGWSFPRLQLILLAALALSVPAAAQELSAQALVGKEIVMVGEPFAFQIRLDGSESPDPLDLGAPDGFSVQELGGSQNSSTSVTIVNGKMSRVVKKGYIFNYRLTAKRAGELVIPSVIITAEGKSVRTNPVQIRAIPPQESDDFKLRLSFSENRVYLGQPFLMTVTWYVGRDVRSFEMNVPVLDDERLQFDDPEIQPDPDRHLQIAVNGEQIIAEKGRGALEGRDFLTVQFQKIVVPLKAGAFTVPAATVAGQAVRGYQRRRSVFDDFFSDDAFGFGRQAVLENFVAPSNRTTLEVLEVPAAGRPPNFSGLIGDFRIKAAANPTEVNVGDPITLNVELSGPSYLGHVELPRLTEQPLLAQNFKVPQDRASGVVSGHVKRFTQTLRARHSGVTEIPPIELAYFNPKTGNYEVARSEPIPLSVSGTRVLTASDAEGLDEPVVSGSALESAEGGIGANFDGPEALVSEAYGPAAWLGNPAWLAGLALPPVAFLAMLSLSLYGRWKDANPTERRARQAFRILRKQISRFAPADTDEFYASALDGLRTYLGAKLNRTAGSLTFADASPALESRGASKETIRELKRLFDRCEAGRYAGSAFGAEDPAEIREAILETGRKLEGELR